MIVGPLIVLILAAVKILLFFMPELSSELSSEVVEEVVSDDEDGVLSPSEKIGNENSWLVENAFCPAL